MYGIAVRSRLAGCWQRSYSYTHKSMKRITSLLLLTPSFYFHSPLSPLPLSLPYTFRYLFFRSRRSRKSPRRRWATQIRSLLSLLSHRPIKYATNNQQKRKGKKERVEERREEKRRVTTNTGVDIRKRQHDIGVEHSAWQHNQHPQTRATAHPASPSFSPPHPPVQRRQMCLSTHGRHSCVLCVV